MATQKQASTTALLERMVTRPSAVAMRRELERAGCQQGQTGTTEVECENCEKNASGKRGWWQKISYEYDEWKCLCKQCAYDELHQYDDFDSEAFERAMNAV